MKFLRLAFYVLIAQLVLSGCAGEGVEETSSSSSSEINFDAYLGRNASTRAGVTDINSLKKSGFGVFARYNHNGNISSLMDNEHVTWEENHWKYTNTRYWPNEGFVDFYAFAPYHQDVELVSPYSNSNKADSIYYIEFTSSTAPVDLVWGAQIGKKAPISPTDSKVKFQFNEDFSEVTFSLKKGNDEDIENIKISKGEESNFVWSIFYSLLEQVVSVLNVPEESDRETDKLNQLEYIFIDDPVTSLDDNHLIQMAVNLSDVIRKSESDLKFIITTHSPLFYNVLYNELKIKNNGYMLEKNEDGNYELDTKFGDSNENFSYHHHLIGILKRAIEENKVEKYHFTLLRNLYEKAANFLGYEKWSDLLPDDKEVYAKRVMNFYSHRTLLNEEVKEPTEAEKQTVKLLLEHLIDNAKFWKEAE